MSSTAPTRASATADELERIAADALDLCAIPAPTFGEDARAAALVERFARDGTRAERDPIGNVLARQGGSGPAVVVCAHLDTVFAADTPIGSVRDDGVLRGAGIGDDALGLAVLLHLARRFAHRVPATPVLLAGTVGEEGLGDLRGVTHLLDHQPAVALIAVEGHGIDSVAVGGVASVRLRVDITGPGGHPWSDRGRGSAIHTAVGAADRALAAAPPATINIGTISGGDAVNTIAGEASLLLDLRHTDHAILAAAERRVRRAIEAFTPRDIVVSITEVGRRPGGRGDQSGTLIAAAHAARAEAGLGRAWEHDASTDANAALARGIPAITMGVTRGGNAHRRDEWVALAPITRGVRAIEGTIRGFADGLDLGETPKSV